MEEFVLPVNVRLNIVDNRYPHIKVATYPGAPEASREEIINAIGPSLMDRKQGSLEITFDLDTRTVKVLKISDYEHHCQNIHVHDPLEKLRQQFANFSNRQS